MSEDSYGCQRVPTGVCGQILVSDGAKWCLMVSMCAYWYLSVATGI